MSKNEIREIAQMLEENRHARWEHKQLRQQMKLADIYAGIISTLLIIFVIVVDILMVKGI